MAKILKKKVLKCLWERKVVDIGILRPAIITQVITKVVEVVDIGLLRPSTITHKLAEVVYIGQVWPATLPLVITKDILIDVDIGHKIPATITLEI